MFGSRTYAKLTDRHECRLFHGSSVSAVFKMEEIYDFTYDDLHERGVEDKVVLLDAFYFIVIWAGQHSRPIDQRLTIETGLDYVEAVKSNEGRPTNLPLYFVQEKSEPLQFTTLFLGWDEPQKRLWENKIELASDVLKMMDRTYTFKELTQKPAPKYIDVTKLESYLSIDEFKEIFKMNKEDYEKLPVWKQESLKKDVELY